MEDKCIVVVCGQPELYLHTFTKTGIHFATRLELPGRSPSHDANSHLLCSEFHTQTQNVQVSNFAWIARFIRVWCERTLPVLSLILNCSKKETPCFHWQVSIQIDSSLPQGITQPVSRRSDVSLQNKSTPKTRIWPVLSLILDSSKKETPCFHRTILIQIDSPLPQCVTQLVSRQSDVL